MTEMQSPRRRSYTAKTIFGLLLAIVLVAVFATAGSATPPERTTPRDEGVPENTGLPGGFCTITGSNLNAIRAGMKVVYTNPAVVRRRVEQRPVRRRPGQQRCLRPRRPQCRPARPVERPAHVVRRDRPIQRVPRDLAVTCDMPAGSPCAWDGPYSFTPPGHDK